MEHPLDRPIWNALRSRQAGHAQSAGQVLRYDPAFAPFAASYEATAESYRDLAALVPSGGRVVIQQEETIEAPPGLTLVRNAPTVQMIATKIVQPDHACDCEALHNADAAEMRALADLTKPGPFAERTHELGQFFGVRREGRLVAMAGERMKLDGFAEVSGVCTHPDYRGKGLAAALVVHVAKEILLRGETPFLHAFADNLGAIALYERLGFTVRWRPALMVFEAR